MRAVINTVSHGPGSAWHFCEASDVCLVRYAGTDDALIELAKENAYALAAGHSFYPFYEGYVPGQHIEYLENRSGNLSSFSAPPPTHWKVIIAETDQGARHSGGHRRVCRQRDRNESGYRPAPSVSAHHRL